MYDIYLLGDDDDIQPGWDVEIGVFLIMLFEVLFG